MPRSSVKEVKPILKPSSGQQQIPKLTLPGKTEAQVAQTANESLVKVLEAKPIELKEEKISQEDPLALLDRLLEYEEAK